MNTALETLHRLAGAAINTNPRDELVAPKREEVA